MAVPWKLPIRGTNVIWVKLRLTCREYEVITFISISQSLINQSINQSISHAINYLLTRSINHQFISHSLYQLISQSISQSINQSSITCPKFNHASIANVLNMFSCATEVIYHKVVSVTYLLKNVCFKTREIIPTKV